MNKKYYIFVVLLLSIVGCEDSTIQQSHPVANNDTYIITESVENKLDILSNDISPYGSIDKSSIKIISQPKEGDITIDTQTGSVIYLSHESNQTKDQFTYEVTDSNGVVSNEAIVILNIKKPAIKATNWYIRVIAINETDSIVSSDSKFGELDDNNASDYNLKLYTAFSQSQLSVIFQDNNQSFKSLFYPYSSNKKFHFLLKSANANADIVLKWQGIYVLDAFMDNYGRKRYKEYRYTKNPIVYNLKLVDKKTGLEIPAIENGRIYEYRFNMDGSNSREFMWVLSDSKVDIKMLKSTSLKEEFKVEQNNHKLFELNSPPKIYDRIKDETSLKK